MAERQVEWISSEMDNDMKNEVETQVNKAIDQTDGTEEMISKYLKHYFDGKFGPNWHCCVGKHFASYVTYQSKHYIFFKVGEMCILLYKL